MTEKLKVQSSDVESALAIAAQQLKVPLESLKYQLLEEKKSFMGLKKVVELEVWIGSSQDTKEGERANQVVIEEKQAGIVNGTIGAVEGKLVIAPPEQGGLKAVLIPGDEFVIEVNGKKLTAPTEVGAEDAILVEPIVTPGRLDFSLEISPDRMTVTGVLNKVKGVTYKLKDTEPAMRLKPSAIAVDLEPEPLTREIVMTKLVAANVVFGISEQGIKEILAAEESTKVVLAQGRPGKPPVNETLSLLFEKKKEAKQLEETETINHWEKNNLITVDVGEVLAVKTPAQLGEKGMDVTGKEWEPPLPRFINLQAGPGVELMDDGLKYVSLIDGQPMIKGGHLTVLPVYNIKAVNIESGNIRFNGTVIVQNLVEENMVVEAKDDVEVHGSVNSAKIRAGGNISINKNVVSSHLHAGGDTAVYQTILKMLMVIMPVLGEMESKAKLAREAMGKKGMGDKLSDGYLIKIMLENMYPQVPKTVKELADHIAKSEIELDEELVRLVSLLKLKLLGLGPTQMDFPQVHRLKQLIGQMVNNLQIASAHKATVKLGYMQNSVVVASGDVIINGKGVYNSNINAGGAVRFTGRPGVFRGGTIQAEGDVEIGELGSPTGAITNVTIPKHCKIKARLVYPNVTIKIGNFCEKIQNEGTSLEAWVSERGLEVTKLKGN